jgi:hypothetical protein
MTSQQNDTIKEYENEVRKRGGNPALDWKESNSPESRGVLFANVDGVTLMIYADGLMNIPARCSWSFDKYTHVTAAACAKELWTRQKRRDGANPRAAKKRAGGHLGPIVGPNLKCGQDRPPRCPCQDEESEVRRKRSLGARNAKGDTRKEKFRNYSGCP